jgi:hypothetical protein
VALRTAQDFSDFLDGQDVRCVFHVPSILYASTAVNRDGGCTGSVRPVWSKWLARLPHGFIGILGALGDQGLFGILGGGQKGPFTCTAARHSRGSPSCPWSVENGVFLGKLGADLAVFFGILGANRRQSGGI